ncbi:hypothetical protein E4K67_26540 [Desulfosporosinus fructosivorans]|uniref:Uncharacterized protein n=1 Tax=Desulfosporosinus fructosivorans TaxID=2018669 RepID=A0A4Z0QXZ5_9FIRM|nr:hypothetical protein [Desulfosporosinus fructosivorans]TGE35169.1 hypothetical protein E4K67_26540 [Desulfosporosinus fructosivorans]
MPHGRRETSLFPVLLKNRIKVEFGYDERKGVEACDRGPSGLGDYARMGTVLRLAFSHLRDSSSMTTREKTGG